LSRAASLALFAMPTLALTLFSFLVALIAGTSGGVSLLAPLAVISLTLAAHAVRERSAGYAFASGLTINLATTLRCVLRNATPITIIQANLIAAALFSLAWLEALRRLAARVDGERPSPSLLLRSQICFTLFAALSLLADADARLLFNPSLSSEMAAAMG